MTKYLKFFLYFFVCFFIFGIVIRIGSVYVSSGEMFLSFTGVMRNLKMSVIASFAITLIAFIFNKMDECKNKTHPPSGPKA